MATPVFHHPDAAIVETIFTGLDLTKLGFVKAHVLYGAKVPSMFQNDFRYIFATVDATVHVYPQADVVRLADLPWSSVQTRLVSRDTDKYRLPAQRWRGVPRDTPHVPLQIRSRSDTSTLYGTPGGLSVELLHDPSKNTAYQYHNRMSLASALETFHAVVSR